MPERAEIEAVVHSSRIYAAAAALKPWIGSSVEAATLAVKMAVAAVEAADRVCDARGEYQCAYRQMQDRARAAEVEVEQLRAINAELVEAHNTLLVEAARSPQGEDHSFSAERSDEVVRKFYGPQGEDHEARDEQGRRLYPTVLHGEAATAARLAEHSPSRDGTVAVEDVEKALLTLDEAWRVYWHSAVAAAVAGYASTGRLRDHLHETRDRLLAEFGSARAGESNEGGNQNDERRH